MSAVIAVSRSACETVIHIKGRFTFEVHTQFREAYREDALSLSQGRRFVVDLTGAEFIDSSGLGMLLLLREMTDSINSEVEIVNARPEILKMLHTAKFEQLFKIA
ncbi:MAG: STAS domain-containing protein [Magnetococcus sp. YQC-3]